MNHTDIKQINIFTLRFNMNNVSKYNVMIKITSIISIILIALNCYSQKHNIAITGDPPNTACKVVISGDSGKIQLYYENKLMLTAQIQSDTKKTSVSEKTVNTGDAITQIVSISGNGLNIRGIVNTSEEALVAETNGNAQKVFPMIRTTIGNTSTNLRNNAIYDRYSDFMIEIKCNNLVSIKSLSQNNNRQFKFSCADSKIDIIFRPLFYQKHKGIKYFKPRTYKVWKESITGWSSWWAYFKEFNEKNLNSLLDIWKEKQFADYGYRYIQIDDGYQTGIKKDGRIPDNVSSGYNSYGPSTWLEWNKSLFPDGINGYTKQVIKSGFLPAVWVGAFFTDLETTEKHPDWFIQDEAGKPYFGPWIGFATDATNKEAVENLIRPTFKGLHKAGIQYVKIDQLRHYLYDNLHQNLKYCKKLGYTPDEIFRACLKIAREELGKETFMLSCWGVLPQSVGIADACRIGGDGYGPVTMQQYNSWNGIVWINDPDHCDVYPDYKPTEIGNVTNKSEVVATTEETKLRPSLASIAGCMLMLSDKPEVYENDNNLEGLRRSSPVLFSVPGQLYDFDTTKSSRLPKLNSLNITSGAGYSPLDADQFGPVCPWWLNEINRSFENWNVLSRMNWTKKELPGTKVNFSDIGLMSKKEYLVFEFWSKQFIGVCKDYFETPNLKPNGINSFSIREKNNHPQIISTNRHLSQGGVDLKNVVWKNNVLSGKSKVVKNDKYEIYIYIPERYSIKSATFNSVKADIKTDKITQISFIPSVTGNVDWKISFTHY